MFAECRRPLGFPGFQTLAVPQRVALLLISGSLIACSRADIAPPMSTSAAKTADSSRLTETVDSDEMSQNPPLASANYADAIQLASSAFLLGRSAQSLDDWQLVTSRWQQAMAALNTIPQGDVNYTTAQAKLAEYQRNLNHAQQRLEQFKNPPPISPIATPVSTPAQLSGADGAESSTPSLPTDDRFQVPILRRQSGTPVIEVAFNGGRRYPMILDTGASHTLITRTMANELGVITEGQINATTASNQNVVFDIGRVDSMRVSDITRQNVTVGIGDSVEIGLLGNDFYAAFDLVLQEQSVEFRVR